MARPPWRTGAQCAFPVGLTSLPSSPVVREERPFLLAIRERLSGTVLFAGLIVRAPVE